MFYEIFGGHVEVYNLGGGRENSCSILEAFKLAEHLSGQTMQWEYVDQNREGDHICYISDLAKIKAHYPGFALSKSLEQTMAEIVASWKSRD